MAAPKQLRATSGGQDRIVGFWHGPEDGAFKELYRVAREACNNITGLQIAHGIINGDKRLSDEAKKADRTSTAKERLYFLGQLQRVLDVQKTEVVARASRLSAVQPYRDNDPITVQIDIALAGQLRSMDYAKRSAMLIVGTEKAYVDAALRLPRELTGLSEETYRRVTKEALLRASPREAQEIDELLQASEDAQETLRKAFDLIAKDCGIPLDDRVNAARESATDLVQGVSETTVERMQERQSPKWIDDDKAELEAKAKLHGIEGADGLSATFSAPEPDPKAAEA